MGRNGRVVIIGLAIVAVAACGGGGSGSGGRRATDSSGASGATQSSDSDAGVASRNVAGRHDHHLDVGGQTRDVIVYVPEKAAGTDAPVVFMLHGTSGDGEKFFQISGWREKADEEGLIAVFPSALTYCIHEDQNGDGDNVDREDITVTTKWNAGNFETDTPLCTDAEVAALSGRHPLIDHPVMDDIAFMGAILDLLAQQYSVDADRIYASGFSNGGQMTSRMAEQMADRFAAIGAAAGPLAVPPAPAARPISVLVSFGSIDDRVIAVLGVPSVPLDATVFDLGPLDTVVHQYLTVLQLDGTRVDESTSINGARVARFAFRTSTAGAANELDFLVIEGATHEYPNGRNHPVSMPDLLWDFFEAHPRG